MNIPEHQNLIRDAIGLAATGNASRQDAVRNTQSTQVFYLTSALIRCEESPL